MRAINRYRYNDVTIEIAPRGSGKTQRLIEKAIEHVSDLNENYSVIVSSSFHETRRTQGLTRHRTGIDDRIKFYSITNIGQNSNLWRNIGPNYHVKFFFDEFEQMGVRLPFYLEHAYYTSSPVRQYSESNLRQLFEYWGRDQFRDESEEWDMVEGYEGIRIAANRERFTREFMADFDYIEGFQAVPNTHSERNDDFDSEDSYLYRLGV